MRRRRAAVSGTGSFGASRIRRRARIAALGLAGLIALGACGGGGAGDRAGTAPAATGTAAPAVTTVSPAVLEVGTAGATIGVTGRGFTTASVVRWNGQDRPTSFIGPAELRAELLPDDLATAGSASITVHTPPPGGGTSAAASVAVQHPAPVVTAVSPAALEAGATGATVVVAGRGFAPTSVVRWNGQERPTTYVGPTELRVALSAADLVGTGPSSVTVFTPAPGGGTSQPASIAVSAPRTLLFRGGVAATQTGDARLPALAADDKGAVLAAVDSGGRVAGGVLTLPGGGSVAVSLAADGLPSRMVIAGVAFTFAGYTATTVDVVAARPGGEAQVFRAVPRVTPAGSAPIAGGGTSELARRLAAVARGLGIAACTTAPLQVAEALRAATAVARGACAADVLTTLARVTGGDAAENAQLEASRDAFTALGAPLGCAGESTAACVRRAQALAAGTVGELTAFDAAYPGFATTLAAYLGARPPAVTITMSPREVVAATPVTLEFTVTATSTVGIVEVRGAPCELPQPRRDAAGQYPKAWTASCGAPFPSGIAPGLRSEWLGWAVDPLGQGTYSPPVSLTVTRPPPPTVTLAVSPGEVAAVRQVTLTFRIEAASSVGVASVQAAGQPCEFPQPRRDAAGLFPKTWAASCSVTYPNGLGAKDRASWLGQATDAAGQVASSAAAATLTVVLPPPPTITVSVSPTEVLAGTQLTLSFQVSAASSVGVAAVAGLPCEIAQPRRDASGQYPKTWTAACTISYLRGLTAGERRYTGTVTDAAAQTASAETVTLNVKPRP